MALRSIALVLAASLVAGCASTSPPFVAEPAAPAKRASAPPAPRDPRPVYRLDFVVSSTDGGKPAASGTYTINLEEERGGEILMGANVMLSPTSAARQDVGIKLRCSFRLVGENLLLQDNVEVSALEEPSTIRKVMSNGTAVVAPGKPALVASAEDVATHRRYQVMVTATKVQ